MLNILTSNVPIDEFEADLTVLYADPMNNLLFDYKNFIPIKKRNQFGEKPDYKLYGNIRYLPIGTHDIGEVKVNPVCLAYCKKRIEARGTMKTIVGFTTGESISPLSFDSLLQCLSSIGKCYITDMREDKSKRFTVVLPTFNYWDMEEVYNSIVYKTFENADIDLVLINVMNRTKKLKYGFNLAVSNITVNPQVNTKPFVDIFKDDVSF